MLVSTTLYSWHVPDARLKLENSWSGLSLDEVENLYFRPFRAQEERRHESLHQEGVDDEQEADEETPSIMEVDPDSTTRRPRYSDQERDEDADEDADAEGEEDCADETHFSHRIRPSTVALGKRKAINDGAVQPTRQIRPRPDTQTTRSCSPNDGVRPSELHHAEPLLRMLSSSSRASTAASSVGRPLPTDYAEFWNTRVLPPAKVRNATPSRRAFALRSSPGLPSMGLAGGDSIRDGSPPREGALIQRTGLSSTTISLPPRTLSVPTSSGAPFPSESADRSFGRPLGAEASFSSLPPIPPLPFPLPTNDSSLPPDESSSNLSSQRSHEETSIHRTTGAYSTVGNDYPSNSQESQDNLEEVDFQALDDAFGQ